MNTRIEEVTDLLRASLPDVFSTMLTIDALPIPPAPFAVPGEAMVASSVGFVGEVNGVVFLHLTAAYARVLAGRMLDLPQEELEGDDATVNDVIGELSNMVVGAVKSRLCDEGAACTLTIPSLIRGAGISVGGAGQPHRRLVGFLCGTDEIVLELLLAAS